MKVLWITNTLFPELEKIITGRDVADNHSGGWMVAAAEMLVQDTNIQLIVATVSKICKKITKISGKKITYYILPFGRGNLKFNPEYGRYWTLINESEKPDLVHIHGTELSHGVSYVKVFGGDNVVVSIQGLIGEIGKHYCDGIQRSDIYKHLTLHDLIKGNCFTDKKRWIDRAKYENELLSSVNHIIGRTIWDRSHVWAINPKAIYHHCNETLRDPFYIGKWTYDKCAPHSIFVSQSYYPVKGLHQLLKAMPLILRDFPDASINVAGTDITSVDFYHRTSYGVYLKSLIHKYSLSGKIHFSGPLSASDMKYQYLKCNVFICPSSIENSSNSIGEALQLGVPVISSSAGGSPSLMEGVEKNMYCFDDIEELAFRICCIFKQQANCNYQTFSAKLRFCAENNNDTLLRIYRDILCR